MWQIENAVTDVLALDIDSRFLCNGRPCTCPVIAIGLLRLSLWAFWAANLMMLILFASLTGISIIFYYEYIYYDMSRITILAIFIPAISGIFWCLLVFEKHKLRFR